MQNIPAAVTIPDNKYHFFKVRKASTKGAHKNFNTPGNIVAADSPAMASIEIPAFENKYASVTVTNPPLTPKGNTKNKNMEGCA
jgi:hypothetical protein